MAKAAHEAARQARTRGRVVFTNKGKRYIDGNIEVFMATEPRLRRMFAERLLMIAVQETRVDLGAATWTVKSVYDRLCNLRHRRIRELQVTGGLAP